MDKGHGKLTVICTDWRPYHKNTLCGFALVRIAELGLKIHDIAITDDNGKISYAITLEFGRRAVIDAVTRFDRQALAVTEAATS